MASKELQLEEAVERCQNFRLTNPEANYLSHIIYWGGIEEHKLLFVLIGQHGLHAQP